MASVRQSGEVVAAETHAAPRSPPPSTRAKIIAEYDMDILSTGESIAVLASLFSVMWVGAYIALRRVAKNGSA